MIDTAPSSTTIGISHTEKNSYGKYSLFASCTRYLEPVLAQEIEKLGGENIKETRAGVSCTGSLETAYSLCLWSRTASRILIKIAEGDVESEEDLYTLSSSVRWDEHFDVSAKFSVSASASHPVIKNDRYAALKIKDGVADYFRGSFGSRPTVDTERPEIRIYGRIEKSAARLYIDLAGESLHKRGYRLDKTEAPLRETTAAAILYKAGWPEIAGRGGVCIDPMCGSGTILIEAALMAFDIAPGVLRKKFGFEKWKKHEAGVWEKLKREASRRKAAGMEGFRGEHGSPLVPIIAGLDKDRSAVQVCRENLRRAGLEKMVQVRESDFRDVAFSKLLPNDSHEGLIAVNPPYGMRLEEQAGVRPLYSDLENWMSREFPGFRAVVLTAGKEAAKYLGLRAEKINVFYNGPVKGALAFFELGGNNIFREYGASGDETSGVQAVANRIRKNRKKLKKYLKEHGISSYRVYDADIPQYSAAIDVYEDTWFVVQEYAPPKTVDPEKAEIRLKEILEAVEICFETTSETVFLKQRRRQRREGQYEKNESPGGPKRGVYNIVREGGLQFFADFSRYIDTGIFLDHRITRDLVRRNAEGRRVLNLFAYTCTASVYAVDGGAESVTSVDASSTYLEWGKKNFQLNNISLGRHSFIRQDAMEFLQTQLEKDGRDGKEEFKFGLVFIDPPTFSNRKDSPVDFEVQRDHVTLISRAAELLEPGGLIIFSNNFRRFVLSPDIEEKFSVREVSAETLPVDFERNPKIHGTWTIQKKKFR
ncbi:MAG: bifunctional 23S rRNA (guanine(2069)-N(7))-methyltransferase RlmK/23S rRNA (guanine(2445)-N(2))-methyltransferase RlmL [Spirochaetaceae bacterium]